MPADESPGRAQWSEHELKLINHVEVFQYKQGIIKKAEGYLEALKGAMAAELAESDIVFPPGADLVKGQIVKGENLQGFPFLSLDIPQSFTKTEYFTMRTLFWWGHYLGFSLILKGERLPRYLDRLIELREAPDWADIHLSAAPTPWEWERENFLNVAQTAPEKLRQTAETNQYLKLIQFHPLSAPTFSNQCWTPIGLKTWKTLSRIT